MKIIDLLNKIVNGEEVPKKIKFDGIVYFLHESDNTYYSYFDECIWSEYCFRILNKEVEILDDEDEEKGLPEKLIPTSLKGIDNLNEKIEIAHIDTISVIDTVNLIIDYLEKQRKGE